MKNLKDAQKDVQEWGNMSEIMKNIAKAEILNLKEQVSYMENQVVSKTLVQNQNVNMTLFAFAKNEEIRSHESKGDAFILCLDGMGEITIDEEKYILIEGQTIVMPAGHQHGVYAKEQFKMLIVVTF